MSCVVLCLRSIATVLRRYNLHLAAGLGLVTGTLMYAVNSINPNATPDFVRDTGYSTKLPGTARCQTTEIDIIAAQQVLLGVFE